VHIEGDGMKPLAIDLYCGLGGWAEGFLSEGYRVIGFDVEAHDYGTGGYPGDLVLRDVRSIHGSEFKDAAVIVGSSPCQEFSYRAMPWKRAKALPPPHLGIELFQAQFRIQREACEAAGRYIPLIVENVRGAQKWVGRARWNFGSFYLWGDVPALMPMTHSIKNGGGSWFAIAHNTTSGVGQNPDGRKVRANCSPRRWEDRDIKRLRDNFGWSGSIMREGTSHGLKRKRASALIAKIPFPLAQHIARCFKPSCESEVTA
jgi:C-5 cytosine-specific DNA methylase